MSGEKGQSADAYYECAWLLMVAGQSPFKERSDGMRLIPFSSHDVLPTSSQEASKNLPLHRYQALEVIVLLHFPCANTAGRKALLCI